MMATRTDTAATLAVGMRVRVRLDGHCHAYDRPELGARHPSMLDGRTGVVTALLGRDLAFSGHRYGVHFDEPAGAGEEMAPMRGGCFAARELEPLAI